MDGGLIYDVGVHDGKDTAFYLSRGFRVIGIEANPIMANQLRTRFASEIQHGAFLLLNVAVGSKDGEAEFWISEHSEWSSFSREMASRDGRGVTPVTVKTRPFGSIVAEHGVAHYCKVDIEGFDRVCVSTLDRGTRPRYISIEMSLEDPGADLKLLKGLGYSKFKIVSQVTHAQTSPALMRLQCALPWRAAMLVRKAETRFRGVAAVGDWRFEPASSGAFAEDTPGAWRSYDSIVRRCRALKSIEPRREARGLHEWFDIHATC
jgi:FkbM family methyltransferase